MATKRTSRRRRLTTRRRSSRRHGDARRPTTFKKGDRVFFEYHCWQSEDSADAKLWHHTRQYAKVIGLHHYPQVDRENDPTYEVEFTDGFVHEAMQDEVTRRPVPNPTKRGVIMPSCPRSCRNREPD